MKNISKKNKKQIDAMMLAKKDKNFWLYSQPAKIKTRFAAKVFDLRKEQNISQQILAKNIKTSQKVISKIENAEVNLGIDLLARIANVLNFSDEDWAEVVDCSFKLNISVEAENKPINKSYEFSNIEKKNNLELIIS